MRNIFCYLDNAATSYPKPYSVVREMEKIIIGKYGNPGRSGHFLSRNSADAVFGSRNAVSEFIGLNKPENICFTHNASYALNIAISGVAQALSDRIIKPYFITDVFEHNSVLRPLYRLERQGKIRLKIIAPDKSIGNTASVLNEMQKGVSCLILTALSNTAGESFDLEAIGKKARENNIIFIIDASQMLGSLHFDIKKSGADIVCAPCHKGLLGIMGAGFSAFAEDARILPEAILSGGSGSDSANHFMPSLLPDRLEAGTLAVPAITAVKCGIDYIKMRGEDHIASNERLLKKQMIEALSNMPNIVLYGAENPFGPILFNVIGKSSDEVADYLDSYAIAVRSGLHCAPLAHSYYGTSEKGAVRISFGAFNTKSELHYAIDKIYRFAK